MDKEIECRFLEIDKAALVEKLLELGAEDMGEQLLRETIIYGPDAKWQDERRFIRIRTANGKTKLTYKEHTKVSVDGAFEIELDVDDHDKAESLMEKAGLPPYRRQEKRRHTLKLDGVSFDIDTWPKIPVYVELEGPSEEALKKAAAKAGLDWAKAELHDARWVIENVYKIPVGHLKWFTSTG